MACKTCEEIRRKMRRQMLENLKHARATAKKLKAQVQKEKKTQ
jgi:hypothetical protein